MFASWLFWALLAALFAALMSICAKLGLQKIDSDAAQLFRTLVVLVFTVTIVAARGTLGEVVHWSSRTWILLGLSGLATAASWVCYFRALNLGEATRVASLDKLSLVIVAILAAVFLGERLKALDWCGVTLVVAGLVLLSMKS
jgi:bacterial/archaeal transporter family protein